MEKIVAAVNHRDYVLVFTDRGRVFRILHDQEENRPIVETSGYLTLKPLLEDY